MDSSLAMAASNPILFHSSKSSTIKSAVYKRVSCGLQAFAVDPMKPKKKITAVLTPFDSMGIFHSFPHWKLILPDISALSAVAEKMWSHLNWNMRQPDMVSDPFESGTLLKEGRIYQQIFRIRSYEIGANGTASLEAILNYLQECVLTHSHDVGLSVDGFGTSPEMSKRNLILIVCRTQMAVDAYPIYGDTVQVSTWLTAEKTAFRRYFLVSDYKTGKTLIRVNSMLAMMNKLTRRFARIREVKMEFDPYLLDTDPIMDVDRNKIQELDETTADYVCGCLIPELNDLDVNQHVNNSKFLGLILESIPLSLKETHELSTFTLDYRQECRRDDVLQSLAANISIDEKGSSVINTGEVEFNHLLRLENGATISKARTSWRLKSSNTI